MARHTFLFSMIGGRFGPQSPMGLHRPLEIAAALSWGTNANTHGALLVAMSGEIGKVLSQDDQVA